LSYSSEVLSRLGFCISLTQTRKVLFFSISFYGTGINWVTLSFGDLFVKIFVSLTMLIPFRFLLSYVKEVSKVENKISV